MSQNDPYFRLKPLPPTPIEEICHCKKSYPIFLCYAISENPLRCANCNCEIQPERLQLSSPIVDEIATWRRFYSCFYHLWLDSGEFEEWARLQLSDPHSPANERGYKLCEKLKIIRRCYYWWFQDTGSDLFEELDDCPRCNQRLVAAYNRLVCEECNIMVAN
jgi:hypothetical protein